ncbi:MAG: AAA family ATPase [Oleiphilaceae bacterium]|nr:AAA family ATPase [Oleiphilaceae bacterium]
MKRYIDAGSAIKETYIQHPIWAETLELCYANVAMAEPSEVVTVIGPSRVGKSKLSLAVRGLLNPPGVALDDKESLSIGVRASNCSKGGAFSTKAFAQKTVTAFNHPIMSDWVAKSLYDDSRGPSEASMWNALERGLPVAGKRYMFVDEAQNITRTTGKNGPGKVLDAWKCFAEEAGIVLILTGTYALHDAINQAPHVIGREGEIHFPRYQVTKEELKSFLQILKTYEKHLPIDKSMGSLDDHIQFLYFGSMGCIGHLSRWFRKALARCMVMKSDITLEILRLSRVSDSKLRLLSDDIRSGEEVMAISNLFCSPHYEDLEMPDPVQNKENQEINDQPSTKKQRDQKPYTCNAERRKAGDRVKGVVDV